MPGIRCLAHCWRMPLTRHTTCLRATTEIVSLTFLAFDDRLWKITHRILAVTWTTRLLMLCAILDSRPSRSFETYQSAGGHSVESSFVGSLFTSS
ncbi:hypothetical protein ASF06_13555 [Agreia sp. Leaf244]|nr:hypothetical protein ASF06_13555 [Agreia sp. Leaf244]